MKNALVIMLLVGTAFAGSQPPCRVTFSVIATDEQNNAQRGFGPQTLKWFHDKIAKKYPDVCYSEQSAPIVLSLAQAPAVYKGVRHYTTTQSNPVDGTVTSSDGTEIGKVDGTVQTSTDHAVPYDVDYKQLKLSIEQQQPDGSLKTLQIFDGKTLHGTTIFGGCTSNCHPRERLIENAVKWLHDGGLDGKASTLLP